MIERLAHQISAQSAAIHALLRTTGNAKTLYLLEAALEQYEANVIASHAQDKTLEEFRELKKTLLDAVQKNL